MLTAASAGVGSLFLGLFLWEALCLEVCARVASWGLSEV